MMDLEATINDLRCVLPRGPWSARRPPARPPAPALASAAAADVPRRRRTQAPSTRGRWTSTRASSRASARPKFYWPRARPAGGDSLLRISGRSSPFCPALPLFSSLTRRQPNAASAPRFKRSLVLQPLAIRRNSSRWLLIDLYELRKSAACQRPSRRPAARPRERRLTSTPGVHHRR
jgi:hypothetical protein